MVLLFCRRHPAGCQSCRKCKSTRASEFTRAFMRKQDLNWKACRTMTTAGTRAKHTKQLDETNGEAAAARAPRHASLLCLLSTLQNMWRPLGGLRLREPPGKIASLCMRPLHASNVAFCSPRKELLRMPVWCNTCRRSKVRFLDTGK
jgi:hypothetical protein